MDIENQKHRASRFNKNGKKRRSVFGIDQEDTLPSQSNTNQIKLFGQQHDPNSTTIITPVVLQSLLPIAVKQQPKSLEDKLSGSSSKFVKNEIYYGQFNYNERDDYERKEGCGEEEIQRQEDIIRYKQVEEVEEVREVKKQRKLKRKNKTSINKCQEIILDLQTQPFQQIQQQYPAKLISHNNPSIRNKQDTQMSKQQHYLLISHKNETTSESAEKGSNYSPNTASISIETPKKQELMKSQELLDEDQDNQIGISSFSALLGINNQTISLKPMMYFPLPPNSVMKCYIKRTSSFNLTLLIYLDDHKFLMKSESQTASIGCNHYISLSTQINKNNETYLGKLRSDFVGSVYTLYDSGASEKEKKEIKSKSEIRSVMANVEYQNNILGIKGPRRIKVRIPNPKIKDKSIFKLKDKQTLASLKDGQDIMNQSVIVLTNKKPVWNEKIKTYALNFGGRVKMPSIKNFILEGNDEQTVMTFGKVDNNTFTLEFRYPLSPFQAFGIAMSSFDFKLSCQ